MQWLLPPFIFLTKEAYDNHDAGFVYTDYSHVSLLYKIQIIVVIHVGKNANHVLFCYQNYCKTCGGAKVVKGTKSVKLDFKPGNLFEKL